LDAPQPIPDHGLFARALLLASNTRTETPMTSQSRCERVSTRLSHIPYFAGHLPGQRESGELSSFDIHRQSIKETVFLSKFLYLNSRKCRLQERFLLNIANKHRAGTKGRHRAGVLSYIPRYLDRSFIINNLYGAHRLYTNGYAECCGCSVLNLPYKNARVGCPSRCAAPLVIAANQISGRWFRSLVSLKQTVRGCPSEPKRSVRGNLVVR